MSADQYSERTLGKKLEWGARIAHHHQHVGGRLDGRTFQVEVGASHLETGFGNTDGIAAVGGATRGRKRTSPADTPPSTAHAVNSYYQRPQQRQLAPAVAAVPSDGNNNNSKGIAQRQIRVAGPSVGKGVVEWTAVSSGRGRTAGFPLTVRPTGTKDRHSKVRTAKGLRDRRVRLSAPTAIQFFDVQDRLGYDQPSKAVDWLIKKARAAIDELAPAEGAIVGDGGAAAADGVVGKEMEESGDRDRDDPSVNVKEEEQRSGSGSGGVVVPRAESRAKARERARERAKEKSTSTVTEPPTPTPVAPAPPPPPCPSPPNLQLLPDILFFSQLRQQNSQPPPFDQRHYHPLDHVLRPSLPSDFSSSFAILPQPTTSASSSAMHLLPFASHFFHVAAPAPPTSTAPFVFPDVPPLHFSAPPIYNTPISPRGTLQSIFSNSVSSVPQVPMPPHFMGLLGYGEAPGPSGCGQGDNGGGFHCAADVASSGGNQNSRIPLRIHGMELDPHEETSMPPSSMADFQ